MLFHNRSNYNYHFIIQELAKEFESEFNCLGENTETYKTFSVPITRRVKKKKLKELVKVQKKLQKPQPTDYNLLIAKNLWQAHYQILLIILLKELIKLNANMDMVAKNVKRVGLNTRIASAVLNTQILKDNLILYKCLCCNWNYQKNVMFKEAIC